MSGNAWWMMGSPSWSARSCPSRACSTPSWARRSAGRSSPRSPPFLIGTVALGLYLVIARERIGLAGAGSLPMWIWMGGLLGALYVAVVTLLIPRIGPAAMMCLVIFGQVTMALLLDRFGVLQDAPRTVDAVRILGALLVLVGRSWSRRRGGRRPGTRPPCARITRSAARSPDRHAAASPRRQSVGDDAHAAVVRGIPAGARGLNTSALLLRYASAVGYRNEVVMSHSVKREAEQLVRDLPSRPAGTT